MSMYLKAGRSGHDHHFGSPDESLSTTEKRAKKDPESHQKQNHFKDLIDARRIKNQGSASEDPSEAPLNSLLQFVRVFEVQSLSRTADVAPVEKTAMSLNMIESMVSEFSLRDPSLNEGCVICPIEFAPGISIPVSLASLSQGGVQIDLHVNAEDFFIQSGLNVLDLEMFLQARFPKRRIRVGLNAIGQREDGNAY